MKNFLFFIIIICTLSCTFNDNGYERLGFGKEQKLRFNLLDLNDYIYKPTWIEINSGKVIKAEKEFND